MADQNAAHDPVEMGRAVIAACRALGFTLAGITAARPTDSEEALRSWLAAGKHGTMDWMEKLLDERLDIRRMLPGAKSVLMVGDLYSRRDPDPAPPPGHARVARYARGEDYHRVMKRRLHRVADALRARYPGEEFRTFVDTGPVMEREHAMRAGLGWIGKHTLLINPEIGSYVALAGMVTTLELRTEAVAGGFGGMVPDHCGTCTRCIDACPTGAITPYSVDGRRCISYLTIEHAGEIEPELRERMGEWAFGCDVCQEVCPFNAAGAGGGAGGGGAGGIGVHPSYRGDNGVGASLDVAMVLRWGEDAHRRAMSGSAMKRASLPMLKRNAALAGVSSAGRGKREEILDAARCAAAEESEPHPGTAAAKEAARALVAVLEGG